MESNGCCVVITSKQNRTTPTIFFQLPVAVHLSLSLNPVAAICPQSGLVQGNYSSACGEAGKQLRYREGSSNSELQMTINVRVDSVCDWTANLNLKDVCVIE